MVGFQKNAIKWVPLPSISSRNVLPALGIWILEDFKALALYSCMYCSSSHDFAAKYAA